jgi:hypothetical protein
MHLCDWAESENDVLVGRIGPDPVALRLIEQGFARHAAVVLFIPANGVENELAVVGATILVRLAGDRRVFPPKKVQASASSWLHCAC